jgi:ADP-heptose:LPS heptosyltransferase
MKKIIPPNEGGIYSELFSAMTVIVPRALGATLLSTAVLRQLRRAFPGRIIRCIVQYPELLINLPYIDDIVLYEDPQLFTKAIQDHEVVDLTGTLLAQPNRRDEPQHLVDLLCERANVINDKQGPECLLTEEEEYAAREIVNSLSAHRKPIVVMATRTSTPNKEWKYQNWQMLVDSTSSVVTWLHVGDRLGAPLEDVRYLDLSPRQTVGLLGHVHLVICPDTFLIHAAAARRTKPIRLVALLGSSRPECVSYPSFTNLFVNGLECQPCGRPYSGFDLARQSDGTVLRWPNGKPKKWECDHVGCMDLITVEMVIDKLMEQLAYVAGGEQK